MQPHLDRPDRTAFEASDIHKRETVDIARRQKASVGDGQLAERDVEQLSALARKQVLVGLLVTGRGFVRRIGIQDFNIARRASEMGQRQIARASVDAETARVSLARRWGLRFRP